MAENEGKEVLPGKTIRKGLFEGRVVTGRYLSEYESLLGFEAQELEGMRVINVGAGASRLDKDLENQGIECMLVDFDLNDVRKGFMARFYEFIRSLDSRFDKIERSLDKKPPPEELSKVERTFVRGDARSLPFANAAFDYALCSQMTYQLPKEERQKVFDGLMAVSNRVYVGPLDKNEIDYLRSKASKNNFDFKIHRNSWNHSAVLTRKSLTKPV